MESSTRLLPVNCFQIDWICSSRMIITHKTCLPIDFKRHSCRHSYVVRYISKALRHSIIPSHFCPLTIIDLSLDSFRVAFITGESRGMLIEGDTSWSIKEKHHKIKYSFRENVEKYRADVKRGRSRKLYAFCGLNLTY